MCLLVLNNVSDYNDRKVQSMMAVVVAVSVVHSFSGFGDCCSTSHPGFYFFTSLCLKDITQAQQQRHELPSVTLPGMRVNTGYINFTRGTRYIISTSAVPLVKFMYLVFKHMPGESYQR